MKVFLRFYEELNNFLPTAQQKKLITIETIQRTTVKDVIESLGIPHTEVDLILVNSESENFDYILKDGDHVSVYPMFESFDISSITKLRPEPLRKLSPDGIKFIVDVNLGKLAHLLRMLGFDVRYSPRLESDSELASISEQEHRVLLTRDIGLLKRKNVSHGYYVRSTRPKDQIVEVLRRFDLTGFIELCSRCLDCNVPLEEVKKESVLPLLPPLVAKYYSQFYICPNCRKIYWEGTHFEHMKKNVEDLKKKLNP